MDDLAGSTPNLDDRSRIVEDIFGFSEWEEKGRQYSWLLRDEGIWPVGYQGTERDGTRR